MFQRIIPAIVLLALTTCLPAQASLLLSLSPIGGAVSGTPGAPVGWGYSVINNSPTEWVILTRSSFTSLPGWGNYTDFVFLPENFVMLAPSPGPGDTASQSFSATAKTGAGSFLIDPAANVGSSVTGGIIFYYDRYDGDPTSDGQYIDAATTDPASATVTVNPVPEPSTGVFFCIGIGVVGYARRRMAGSR